MRFIALFKTARRDRIGENKKGFFRPKFSVKPFDEKVVFVIQHFLETKATDVAVGRSINCIAECHVVGGHGLGDGACSAAHAEKSPRYFLTGANFSEGPVPGCV